MTQAPRFTITQLRKEGEAWRARVSVNGDSMNVEREGGGGWQGIVRDGPRLRSFHRIDLHPAVAAKLQEKVRPLEKEREVKR